MTTKRKFGPTLVLVLIGLAVIYFGLFLIPACATITKTCLGFDAINPLCLADLAAQNANITLCQINTWFMKGFVMAVGGLIAIIGAVSKF